MYKIVKNFSPFGWFLFVQESPFTLRWYFAGECRIFNTFSLSLNLYINRFIYVCYAFNLLKEGFSLLHWLTLLMMFIMCINSVIIYPIRFDFVWTILLTSKPKVKSESPWQKTTRQNIRGSTLNHMQTDKLTDIVTPCTLRSCRSQKPNASTTKTKSLDTVY